MIKACRSAENNDDMKKVIRKRLLENYHQVSADYVLSKSFKVLLKDTAANIVKDPKSVYMRLVEVVNELKARRGSKVAAAIENPSQESSSQKNGLKIISTGDKKTDERLVKLNSALRTLKRKIEDLEEAEVNLDDDDDSAYMYKVKYEKRAIDIYNKICELTGESKDAHRIVKKPVKFKESNYKEFNKKLTNKINKINGFPSYYDVYRLLDLCNKNHEYGLVKFQIEDVARQAFAKVGELLKERRRGDLWESAQHWTQHSKVLLAVK